MGVITISLDKDYENKLRELAITKYGKKKGSISKTLIEAINHFSECPKNETAEQRLMSYVENGLHLGKINSKKFRSQIYNDRIKGF